MVSSSKTVKLVAFLIVIMKNKPFTGKLQELINRAELGNSSDVDYIFNHLNESSTFAMTRYVDYALSLVENINGVKRIEYYLFNGSLIQRNYCSLYFNRRGEWAIVKKAFTLGLIDEIQAYSR
jgi:hypothetical protein